jgi:oligoendopeptidase F
MWTSGNARLLNSQFIIWKNKKVSLPEARKMAVNSKSFDERYKIHGLINEALKSVAHFSEAEINAIVTNKKIDDELRNYSKPYHSTVRSYRNEIEVVETLVSVVTKSFSLSQKYYSLKKQLLRRKVLMYPDRAVKSSEVKVKFTFDASYKKLCEIFGKIDSKYPEILTRYFENGQYDVYPKIGKRGGAYCRFGRTNPVMVFLNHTDDFHSFGTYAHEMGHAFHSEFSRKQSKLYYQYSTALAETASTLFESIAFNEVLKDLPKSQQIAALESKLDDEMAKIFRQIACFNFESDIHESVRKNGFISKEELAKLHNKNMLDYLGKSFKLTEDDGYFFVEWSHLRYFFYVYSYAYGLLVSKALLGKYKADPSFWSKIEQFLSSGGNGSPEEILMNIGIDVKNPEFFKEGLKEVEADILLLEKLVKESKK